MKKILLILSALLLTAVGASAQTVVHECVADINDWTITGNTNGEFHMNDWSSEADASGMRTPFIEYWAGSGINLSDATISHTALTGLATGYYEVSIFARAFNENSTDAVSEGITFTANDESVDLSQGTEGEFESRSEEVYDTYNLLVYVEDGTLNIGFTVSGVTACDWLAFKNLEVIYLGESPVGYVAHECEAMLGHWSIEQEGANGDFHLNTWSTETDPSGMVTPFLEYWVYRGDNNGNVTLSPATISHETITGLTAGYYEISIDIRIFSEAGNEITLGGTLSANGASENLLSGSEIHSDTYGDETLVYGTCHLLAQVTEAGTLDISIVIPENVPYNWISFKNLKVVYDGATAPTLEYVTGNMNSAVEQAMKDAVDKYNETFDSDDYTAALAAIEAAEESVAYYAEIAGLVSKLDDAGLEAWEKTDTYTAYTERTLQTSDDFGEDMATAEKAQTTSGTDWSCVARYTGVWTGNTGTWGDGVERYGDEITVSGTVPLRVFYETVTGLPAGTYSVTFYAVANNAWVGAAYGSGIAQVFANETTENVEVYNQTAIPDNDLSPYSHTLTCTVESDGVLEFGLQNIATGGNWYVAEAVGLTLVALAGNETISWEMTEAGWGTLILPFDVGDEEVFSGLTLYAGSALTLDSENSTITVGEASTTIAANTPYLVSGSADTYTFTGTPTNTETSYQAGMLVGTLVNLSQASNDFSTDGSQYVLQNHEDEEGLAFYPITDQSSGVTLNKYHCYLTISGTVSPDALRLPGMETAIKAVESDVIASDAIYDLSGRRVAKAVKGVYIQNGKKVLVK